MGYCPGYLEGSQGSSRRSMLSPPLMQERGLSMVGDNRVMMASKAAAEARRSDTDLFDPEPMETSVPEMVDDLKSEVSSSIDAVKGEVTTIKDDVASLKEGMERIFALLQQAGPGTPASLGMAPATPGSFRSTASPLPPLRAGSSDVPVRNSSESG